MNRSDRQLQLLENIARLRRAQERVPADPDLSAVRADLERELGETVSRRLAARFLGVSHTALRRWIDAGDLPIVYTPNGRDEVPVPALLSLRARLDEQSRNFPGRRHVLEPTMKAGRDRARRMRVGRLLPDAKASSSGHGRAERASLAYHRAVARRLTRSMVHEARHRVRRWQEDGKIDARYADAWERILDKPVREIRSTISQDSERGRDLRQTSPFAGMLSEPERRKILDRIR